MLATSIPDEVRKAQMILRILTPDEYFVIDDSQAIQSLEHAMEVLDELPEPLYQQFAKPDKNDFAIWIRHTIGDHDLATAVEMTAHDRKELIRRLEARIAYLEQLLDDIAGQLSLEEQLYQAQ